MASLAEYIRSVTRDHFVTMRRRQVEATLSGQMSREQLRMLQRQSQRIVLHLDLQREYDEMVARARADEQGYVIIANYAEWNFTMPVEQVVTRSEEELREAERFYMAERQRQEVARLERQAEQAKATTRSMELLDRHLTAEQRHEMKHYHWFRVTGQSGRAYRISTNGPTSYNVRTVDGDFAYCCTPGFPGDTPWGDIILGQKLALEYDEENFLEEANMATEGF